MMLFDTAILDIVPSREPRSGEPGRIHAKIRVYRFQRQAAQFDQMFEDRGEFRLFEGILKIELKCGAVVR